MTRSEAKERVLRALANDADNRAFMLCVKADCDYPCTSLIHRHTERALHEVAAQLRHRADRLAHDRALRERRREEGP
jgi:hypothetical protein